MCLNDSQKRNEVTSYTVVLMIGRAKVQNGLFVYDKGIVCLLFQRTARFLHAYISVRYSRGNNTTDTVVYMEKTGTHLGDWSVKRMVIIKDLRTLSVQMLFLLNTVVDNHER